MKLSLKTGIPVLLAMLAGTALTEGNTRMLLVVASMGIALWTALSLPRPAREEDSTEKDREEDGDKDRKGAPGALSKPGPGGSKPGPGGSKPGPGGSKPGPGGSKPGPGGNGSEDTLRK